MRVGLPETSRSRAAAQAEGLRVLTPGGACEEADVIMVLTPDTGQRALYDEAIAPHLHADKMLMFAHGFNIRYELIDPPVGVDVSMVAPKGPGHLVRSTFVERTGRALPVRRAPERDRPRHASAPSRMRAASVAPVQACSRRPSPRRPRPTCSASRRCSAAASRRWSRQDSTRSPRRATSRSSRISRSCTSSSSSSTSCTRAACPGCATR